MKEFTLDLICCIKCGSKLNLDIIKNQMEIEEGFLDCPNCHLSYPIIEKIPILWTAENYFSQRRKLGGTLTKNVSNKMRNFLKTSLKHNLRNLEDRTDIEERWTKIYRNSTRSKFYSTIKNHLEKLPKSKISVEYGCSIGLMSSFLANRSEFSLGVDRSFSALRYAKNNSPNNLDFVVADSLSSIFSTKKFELVLALNILELVEPEKFLKQISKQIRTGYLVISDPYDFDRGKNSVKTPVDENSVRQNLRNLGFKIIKNTDNPSHIPWNLKLNSRATLNYKTDFIIAKK